MAAAGEVLLLATCDDAALSSVDVVCESTEHSRPHASITFEEKQSKKENGKGKGYSSSQRNIATPNSPAIQDHTVLPSTRQK